MMENQNLDELKKQTAVDNSSLEELLKKEITPEMQKELFEMLKDAQLYLPVEFSSNMFEGIEDSKPGDVFQTTGKEDFDIVYLSDNEGNRAVPLFTSDEAMKSAGIRSSAMVMYTADIADMLKQSDRYSAVAINPLTDCDINMPFDAFIGIFSEPTQEEKDFFNSLNEILEILKKHSFELEEDMAFMVRFDENLMKENAVDGVFVSGIPLYVSTDPKFCENLKYTNILLFDKGKKVLPIGKTPKDEPDTVVAPGTEFRIEKEIDEFTTVWMCGNQPFYD